MTSRASLVGLTEFFYRVFRRLPLCDVTGPRIFEVCRCLPSFTVFFSCAFQPVGLFSVGIGFQQVLTGFNRVSRDDPVAAWMYRRRLFVGTKNKTLGTSTTRRYRVLTYRVSVSSSGLAVAKHRRPPPEGERQFLFLFFSFLFFFAFGFVLFRFSAVVAERLNLHPRRPIGRPRANGNYGRRFHPVVLSLLLRSSFFCLKNFTSMAVGRNLRSGFFYVYRVFYRVPLPKTR